MEAIAVATAFVRHEGEVLACSWSEDPTTRPDLWGGVADDSSGTGSNGAVGGVSAVVEPGEDPVAMARRAVVAATGIESLTPVRTGETLRVEGPEQDAIDVHPVLFDAAERVVEPAAELQATEWLPPTELLRRETVPRLFETYRRVAPTVQSVAADDEHGAATLSIRALAVLRDRAGLLAAEDEPGVDELAYLADRLRESRPSMAVLRNRVNRALATAGMSGSGSDDPGREPTSGNDDPSTPADVERAAIDGIDRALAADVEASMRAAGLLSGWHVLTLSRSGTVLDALRSDTASAISIAESRPAREGIGVAEELVDAGAGESDLDATITVHTDAAIAHRLASADVDCVLVGADAILPDGRVVNKTGTRGAAIAARREGIPVYVAAATDKVTTREAVNLESGHPSAVYDGDAAIDVANPAFDVTPADAIAGVVTEHGVLEAEEIADVAEELRALESV